MIKKLKSHLGLKNSVLVFSALVVLGVIFYLMRDKSSRDFDEIVESGRIKVVTDNGSIGFTVVKDSVYGFQYELVKAFADKLGLELEIAESDDVRTNIYNLMDGEYDLFAGFIPQTTEYRDKVLFTDAVQINRQFLVQRTGDSISLVRNQNDLAGDTISLPKNSPYRMLVEHLSDQIADTVYVNELKNTTAELAVKMVSDSIIRYTICPERLAHKYMKQYPNLTINLAVGYQQAIVWSVNVNSTTLQAKLNEFLNDFIGSEEYWKIYKKYY